MAERYNNLAVELVTAPTLEPVTLDEMRKHLRIEHHDEDEEIAVFLASARTMFENQTCGCIPFTSTYRQTMDRFPDHCGKSMEPTIQIYRAPVQSITSITYVDTEGTTQTLSSSLYRVDTSGPIARITPAYGQSWPSIREVSGAVKITFVAGWASQATIPADIKLCVKLLAAMYYNTREDAVERSLANAPLAAQSILANRRLPLI